MGHASTRAALIYQHARQDRDKVIAAALGDAFKVARQGDKSDKGTAKSSGTEALAIIRNIKAQAGKWELLPGPSWWERATGIEPA